MKSESIFDFCSNHIGPETINRPWQQRPRAKNIMKHEEMNRNDRGEDILREEWVASLRASENKEAENSERLASRRERARKESALLEGRILKRECEYDEDRGRLRLALQTAEMDLRANHSSASKLLGEIGIQYEPGGTTEEDVLRVPKMSEHHAARSLGLEFGPNIPTDKSSFLKIITGMLCAIVSSMAWGGLVTGLNLKRPFLHPTSAFFALLLGLATAITVGWGVSKLWVAVGTKQGSGQSNREVRAAQNLALAVTVIVLTGLLVLDAIGIVRVNSARAALDHSLAVPFWLAFLGAAVVNLSYVAATSYESRARAYNVAAEGAVTGVIASEADAKREDRKRYVLVQSALDALGQVKVVERRITEYREQLKRVESEFELAIKELVDQLPEIPSESTEDEKRELGVLRDKTCITKSRYDSYVASRSAVPSSSERGDQ